MSWTYYSARRLTQAQAQAQAQAQCENILLRDKKAGKEYGFRLTLTEFRCEKAEDIVRPVQQTV